MEYSPNTQRDCERQSLKELKTKLRQTLLQKRKALSAEQKNGFDAAICRKLLSGAAYRYADTLLLYSPLPDEVDITPIAEQAYRQGKTVAFPRCIPGSSDMEFHITGGLHELEVGTYSIMEPPASAPIWRPREHEHAICLLPGLAFDREGYRIGYGKGYYDRYFKDGRTALLIGVAYSDAILPHLPHGRYDITVDTVITEKQIITASPGA